MARRPSSGSGDAVVLVAAVGEGGELGVTRVTQQLLLVRPSLFVDFQVRRLP